MTKKYTYLIIDHAHNRRYGRTRAPELDSAVRHLISKGYWVLEVKEQRWARLLNRSTSNIIGMAGEREAIWFFRQMELLVGAGLPLLRCLEVIKSMAKPKMQLVTARIIKNLERGQALAESIGSQKGVFSSLAVQMIRGGEMSGELESVLCQLVAYLEKQEKIKKQIRGACLYPGMLALFCLAVTIFLIRYVIPRVTNLMGSGVSLPPPILWIQGIGLADIIVMVIIGFAAVVVWKSGLRNASGRLLMDRLILQIPLAGPVVKRGIVSRMVGSIAMLQKSGLTIIESLKTVESMTENLSAAKVVSGLRADINHGMSLGLAMQKSGFFEHTIIQMVTIGEESGRLDAALMKVSKYYEEGVEATIKRWTTMIEPILIIVMAAIVGFIIVGTLVPMLDSMAVF